MSPSPVQLVALDQELLNAVRLIRAGFGQLQNLDGSNDFYHLPLLTLASGFERLMKVMLCLRALETHGEFSGGDPIPTGRKGHDLERLLNRIKADCFQDEYVEKIPVASEDLRYLQSPELADFIRLLSEFGQSARYYSFDVMLGRAPRAVDPKSGWQELEATILLGRDDLVALIGTGSASELIHREISSIVISRLERFARALARLFTIGRIGELAKRHVGHIGSFLHLSDDQLGKATYDPCGRGI